MASEFPFCDVKILLTDAEREDVSAIPGFLPDWEDWVSPPKDGYIELNCGLAAWHDGPHIAELGRVQPPTWALPSSRLPDNDLTGTWWLTWNQGRVDSREIVPATPECMEEDDIGAGCALMVGHSGRCLFTIV